MGVCARVAVARVHQPPLSLFRLQTVRTMLKVVSLRKSYPTPQGELAVLRGADRALREARPALLIEIEQRHQAEGTDIEQTFDHLLARDYVGYLVGERGLRPLAEFDVRRDQLAWLGPGFMPYGMPDGYVHDFLFVRPGTDLSALLASPEGAEESPARHPRV